MSEKDRIEIAKQYVNEQIKTIGAYRAAKSDVPAEQYDKMVQQVAKAVLK
jgi:hypothetical protein